MTRRFAVIGSGASGCYAAEALVRASENIHVDIIERLGSPFGLVRYGVAPDHPGTKAIARTLEKILSHERITWYGMISIGRDIDLSELRNRYDGVILATGVNRDRRLDIPGQSLKGVVGSGAFAGWYNGHPEARMPTPLLADVKDVVIVGNGNVALDVARILAKRPAEFEGSDLCSSVTAVFGSSAIRDITIVGRRGYQDSKFSLHELKELLQIDGISVSSDDLQFDDAKLTEKRPSKSVGVHSELDSTRHIRFRHELTPAYFKEDATKPGYVSGVIFERTSNITNRDIKSFEHIAAQMVVTCIGYESVDRFKLASDDGSVKHVDGRIDERLYIVGWAKRGASGTIGTNRVDSHAVARLALAECSPKTGDAKTWRLGVALKERDIPWVSWDGWKSVDAAERNSATSDRTREKILDQAEFWRHAHLAADNS